MWVYIESVTQTIHSDAVEAVILPFENSSKLQWKSIIAQLVNFQLLSKKGEYSANHLHKIPAWLCLSVACSCRLAYKAMAL